MKHFLKYLPLALIMFFACGKDDFSPIDAGRDYFPLQKGLYQIYNIDSTGYSQTSQPVNRQYQIMVEVTDSFPSSGPSYTYVLSRSIRASEAALWRNLDTWSVKIVNGEAIVSEGNTPYVKLFFPVETGNSWDGNKFNTLGQDDYDLIDVNKPFTLEHGIIFELTLTVQQELNDDPIVFQDIRKEVYARGVGLIHKEINQLTYCTDDSCLGQQIIESGILYKQEIIEYGLR